MITIQFDYAVTEKQVDAVDKAMTDQFETDPNLAGYDWGIVRGEKTCISGADKYLNKTLESIIFDVIEKVGCENTIKTAQNSPG